MTGTNMTNMGIECKHSWTRLMEICCLDKKKCVIVTNTRCFFYEIGYLAQICLTATILHRSDLTTFNFSKSVKVWQLCVKYQKMMPVEKLYTKSFGNFIYAHICMN